MILLNSLLLAFAATLGGVFVSAAPAGNVEPRQDHHATPNSQGYHDDVFYMWWSDGASPVNYTNLDGGSFSVEWRPGGNFIGGKGWEVGTEDRVIKIEAKHDTMNSNSYLGVYGWMLDIQVEYWIIENLGTYDPSVYHRVVSTYECDGSEYRLSVNYYVTMWNPVLPQYYIVRAKPRVGGVVHMKCHFDAMHEAGLEMGSRQGYQIAAVEGYFSSGKAWVRVSEVTGKEGGGERASE